MKANSNSSLATIPARTFRNLKACFMPLLFRLGSIDWRGRSRMICSESFFFPRHLSLPGVGHSPDNPYLCCNTEPRNVHSTRKEDAALVSNMIPAPSIFRRKLIIVMLLFILGLLWRPTTILWKVFRCVCFVAHWISMLSVLWRFSKVLAFKPPDTSLVRICNLVCYLVTILSGPWYIQ